MSKNYFYGNLIPPNKNWIRNALHWGLRSLCINGIPFGWVWVQKKTVPGGTVVTIKRRRGRVLHTQFDAMFDLSKGEVVPGSDTNPNPQFGLRYHIEKRNHFCKQLYRIFLQGIRQADRDSHA